MQRATPGILTLPSCSQVPALAMTAFAIRSRAGFAGLRKRRNCERDVLADHLPVCGRVRHEFGADVPPGNLAQPRVLVEALTYPGAAHRNVPGPSGSGGASIASAAIACMAIVVHGFPPGPAHTDEQQTPARLEHARELGGRPGDLTDRKGPRLRKVAQCW